MCEVGTMCCLCYKPCVIHESQTTYLLTYFLILVDYDSRRQSRPIFVDNYNRHQIFYSGFPVFSTKWKGDSVDSWSGIDLR